ncbi:transcriptional adapter 2-alpha-like [Pomacea canaliculata]|uniref:transcriptional adapter 2-alpha-like n=1 Tax=Pomacea canaliculata TaxID=400727 RepID=UPI000D728F87|nr:transcriptional adapter 2-alpha-like [Pomacea canaliculata]
MNPLMDEDNSAYCPSCCSTLVVPYIRCAECALKTELCLKCFARGVEFGDHQNSHSYCVVKLDFPLYESHWTAQEELQLLKLIESCGYGNWKEIGMHMRDKTGSECEAHYNRYYINYPEDPLPGFPEYHQQIYPTPMVFTLSEDPPRPPEGSAMCTDMAGYSAARGDFSVEYDNFAEMDICNMTFDPADNEDEADKKLTEELNLTLLFIYRKRLKERHRRKRILKDYGLINIRRDGLQKIGVEKELRRVMDEMRVFTTLMSPMENDKLLAGIQYEYDLKREIKRLQEYRTNGLKHLRSIHLYKVLRQRRAASKQKRHLLTDVISHIRDETACQTWLQRHAATDGSNNSFSVPLPSAPRRNAPPLDIAGFPGYENLSPSERELCQTVRLVPKAYQEFRTLLINEDHKHGGLRLAQARTLIKIDVNKTRKLYDFLVQEGVINKIR